MFIFYLHSVDNNELIAKLFTDKLNLIAKSRFLLLILFTCLHFTIDRKLIFPKINEAKSRKPVNRLEREREEGSQQGGGMREKEHCKFKGVPNKFAHCCCCCFFVVASAAALLVLFLLLLPLANLIWPVPTFALPFSFAFVSFL